MSRKRHKFEKDEKINDTEKIEKLAVQHIEKVIIENSEKLSSDIPTNDKGVSFDGFIILTKGRNTIDDYIGRIPIQVKGTQLHKSSGFPKRFKYSLKKGHYENYYSEGGVLLIVVAIIYDPQINKYHKKIYVDDILRLKAKRLIESVPSTQATISTTIKEINDIELESVCYDFYSNFDKQPRMIQVDTLSSPIQGTLTETYISKKQNFLNKEFYISEDKQSTYTGYFTPNQFKAEYGELVVNIGTEKYKLNVSIEGYKKTETVEEYKVVIEGLVELAFGSDRKFVIKQLEFESLEYQLRVLPFITKLLEEKELSIPNTLEAKFNDLAASQEEIEQIKNIYDLLKNVELLYDEYNIDKNIPIIGKYDQILMDFSGLKEVFIDKKYNELKDFDGTVSRMIKINTHNISFLTYYDHQRNVFLYPFDEKLVSDDLVLVQQSEQKEIIKEEYFPSIYITVNDFTNICNINYDAILKSFDTKRNIEDNGHKAIISFLLDRIKEYDTTKNIEILNFCIKLCQLFINKLNEKDDNHCIYTINYYQCIKRKRNLNRKETFELARINLPEEIHQRTLSEFCISVLIDDKDGAQRLISSISDIHSYPIYHLYNNLIALDQSAE